MNEEKSVNVNVSANAPSGGDDRNKRGISLYVIIFVFVASLSFCLMNIAQKHFFSNNSGAQQYNKKIDDSIQKHYDAELVVKDDSIKYYHDKIARYEMIIDSLGKRYNENQKKIESLKYTHNEKAKHIDTLSDDQLVLFFTSRYGQKK